MAEIMLMHKRAHTHTCTHAHKHMALSVCKQAERHFSQRDERKQGTEKKLAGILCVEDPDQFSLFGLHIG